MDENQRLQLIGFLLDGLDDLYDQRFAEGHQAAEVWLVRLLYAAGLACAGGPWEATLVESSRNLSGIVRRGGSLAERGDAALAATDALRHALAAES